MFNSTRLSAVAMMTMLLAPCVQAQNVDGFDPLPGANPIAVAIQPDGKILLGGDFADIAGTVRGRIARLNVDGSLDASFGDPQADFEVKAIAVQPDGKILIGGAFDQVGGQPRHDLARLNVDGSLDTGFADPDLHNGAASGTVWSIALQPDGRILIAGDFTQIGATAQSYLARLNANGALDTDFADPQLCCNVAHSVAVQADDKVLVAGYFSQAGGASHFYLARYSAAGILDAAFPTSAPPGPIGGGMTLGADGSIYVAGGYLTTDQMNTRLVSKLSADGALVTSPASFAATRVCHVSSGRHGDSRANRLTVRFGSLGSPNSRNSEPEMSARNRAVVGSWPRSSSDPPNAKSRPRARFT
jgi:uncharacterized delta-60 repeat protein